MSHPRARLRALFRPIPPDHESPRQGTESDELPGQALEYLLALSTHRKSPMLREAPEESHDGSSPRGAPRTLVRARHHRLDHLTKEWGSRDSVSLYLERCQVETPEDLVQATWRHVRELRPRIGKVVDFGAGDGRFSRHGRYREYVGYEIDTALCAKANLPGSASLINKCAFSDEVLDADLCIGNPPFVRNQDLPAGWRQHASQVLYQRTGVSISGLANAWQYFFFLALISAKASGLCALIIPYEWVSRPSSRAVRDLIKSKGWNVSVYRLIDTTFSSVLTTSSITIVDKAKRDGQWSYFEETAAGEYSPLLSPTGGPDGVIPYLRRGATRTDGPHAKRGLSPGTQKVLTLTEGERVRSGLHIRRDVLPCVTSLRHLPAAVCDLDDESFRAHYRAPNQKCWLIRTDTEPNAALAAYLKSVPESEYQTSTCLERDEWWRFQMPSVPDVLISMSFKGKFPKAVRNLAKVRAVGGVYGIYNLSAKQAEMVTAGFGGLDIRSGVVAHSNGLRKVEISQLNTLLMEAFGPGREPEG